MNRELLEKEKKFIEETYKSGIITKAEYDQALVRVEEKVASLPKQEEMKVSEPIITEAKPSPAPYKLQTYGKKFPYKYIGLGILAVVLIFIIFFSFEPFTKPQPEEIAPTCLTDLDCQKLGLFGSCVNPGLSSANCTYVEDASIIITVINDKDCTLCETDRMKNTLLQLYPKASFAELDKTQAGALIERLRIEALPAFVFDEDVEKTHRFNSTKSTFLERDGMYVMTPSASGASYFFENREDDSLRIFIDPGASVSLKGLQNLIAFATKKRVGFMVHYFTLRANDPAVLGQICLRERSTSEYLSHMQCLLSNGDCEELEICEDAQELLADDMELAEEFGINTVPVFIFNNQYKKGGSLSPELLEDAYCKVNGC